MRKRERTSKGGSRTAEGSQVTHRDGRCSDAGRRRGALSASIAAWSSALSTCCVVRHRMSERGRDRELGPSDEYGGCSRETKEQRRDGGEQLRGGSNVEKWKVELTHCDGGLFGSMYVSQVPGVAARKGWLLYVAERLAQNVLRDEQVEKADITRYELFKLFYEAMERPYRGPLWTLSTKSRKNLALFRDMRLEGVKEKWPRARHAIRILDVMHERDPQWLHHLAEHAADVERGRRARRAEYHLWAMSPVECELAEW